MKFVVLAAAAAVLAGCQTMPQQREVVEISAPFDVAQATRLVADGPNIVRGNAFMRQRGGGVVTCAGSTVNLIPATLYARTRMATLYGNSEAGSHSRRVTPVFSPNPPEYMALVKTTKCDAQGNFVFDRVVEGDFYVQTFVAWTVASSPQGGTMMQRITVRNGQATNVILSS